MKQNSSSSSDPSFTEFTGVDPAAGTIRGTYPTAINAGGSITGYLVDSNDVSHGFLRNEMGSLTPFDVPGAAADGCCLGTQPESINTSGTIAGVWQLPNELYASGFYRTSDGTIATFDLPDGYSAGGLSINDSGVIAGTAGTPAYSYGFILSTEGAFTIFGAPDAVPSPQGSGTIVTGIDSNGDVTGYYFGIFPAEHGFLRAANGTITEFDAPANVSPCTCGTQPASIDDTGEIVGMFYEGPVGSNPQDHSFFRAPDGTITIFDPPEAVHGSFAASINNDGVIAGGYWDSSDFPHAYIRNVDGSFMTLDSPHLIPEQGSATITGINASGAVVGATSNESGTEVGFVYQ